MNDDVEFFRKQLELIKSWKTGEAIIKSDRYLRTLDYLINELDKKYKENYDDKIL